MYRKSVPILAALLISGGIQQTYAADLPAHQQQVELWCTICRQPDNLEGELFFICNDHLVVAHNNCMQARIELGNINCPTCAQEFSEQNLNLILTSLTGGDVVLQVADEQEEDQDDDLQQAIAESLEFNAQVAADERAQQMREDAVLARIVEELSDDVLAQNLQAQEQPQQNGGDNIQQAQQAQALGECVICYVDDDQLPVGTLECTHRFHLGCINQWIEQSHNCPICEAVVPNVLRL